uniref:Conotoxin n=1 Tax=Conus betulinus TaxID=89764 RepID=A0A142C1I7_CONBE|nr:conotoxin [Conus betulinus]
MKIYLCLAVLLLLASTIVDSALRDKAETIRNWRRKGRDKGLCPECRCSELKTAECDESKYCHSDHSCPTSPTCNNGKCLCTHFLGGRCSRTSECNDSVC